MLSSATFSVLDVFDNDSDKSSILSIDDAVAVTGRQTTGPPGAPAGKAARTSQPSTKKTRKKPPKRECAAPSAAAAAAGAGQACRRKCGRPRKMRPMAGPCSLQLYAAAMLSHQARTRSLIWYRSNGHRQSLLAAAPPRVFSDLRLYAQLFPLLLICSFVNLLAGTI